MLKQTLEFTSSLVFPKVCEICTSAISYKAFDGICGSCETKIETIPAPFCHGCGRHTTKDNPRCLECGNKRYEFDRAYSTAYYDGAMKELLHAYKFSGRKTLRHFLSHRLMRFIDAHLDRSAIQAIMAVPMDPSKEKDRGFNHAGLLADSLATLSHLHNLSDRIRCRRTAIDQHRLNKEERRFNTSNSFFLLPGTDLSGKHILLIDDILTTGWTASTCAGELKKRGRADKVTVLTVARGF